MKRLYPLLTATAILVLAGCASDRTAALGSAPDEKNLYDTSISETAVFKAEHVRPLTPLRYPVPAATLTTRYQWAEGSIGQEVALQKDTWLTVEPEVRDICRHFERDKVIQRLYQLLGLKPAMPVDDDARFILYTVDRAQPTGPTGTGIFRPCADPDPTASSCGNSLKGPPAYVEWFANNMLFSYSIATDIRGTGYPWTRLGYTYNWNPGAPSYQGVQEYVAPKGATVRVRSVVKPTDYCRDSKEH